MKEFENKKYDRAQWLFIDMKIEYDAMLEIFDNSIEEQYVKVFHTVMASKDLWEYNLENINTLETTIEKMRSEFKIFKDLLAQFLPSEFRPRYEKLFVLERYQEIISRIQ